MRVIVNQQEREVADGSMVYALTAGRLGRLKIWHNQHQLTQSQAKRTPLSDGDVVQIKRVGGGCC